MPRFVKSPERRRTKDRVQRAKNYHVSGYKRWVDPFPIGFGTVPEKIVYEALSRRGIPFLYLNDIEINIPEIEFHQFFQADFAIPTLRIIIEVQGAHWHSMPKTIDSDALKFAYYEQMGWRALAWWDFDILDNVNKLFAADPDLARFGYVYGGSAEQPVQRRTKTDTSKGIRTLNRRRGERLQYKKKPATIKTRKAKNYGRYTVGS